MYKIDKRGGVQKSFTRTDPVAATPDSLACPSRAAVLDAALGPPILPELQRSAQKLS